MTNLPDKYFTVYAEVQQAIREERPVVVLESTVITHGLPYPENLKLAASLEKVIREGGSTPATIAILDGKVHVGLTTAEQERLAHSDGMVKISSRDIAPALSLHKSGGTTVAGTLAIAERMGIKVFSTGGIGGVHRQAPFDVSADLRQLAISQLVVVCAGAKAILDIPATLEVLETYGVPVVGYRTGEFPAFYSTSSGISLSTQVNSASEVAELAKTQWELGIHSSILVAVPPPQDVAVDKDIIEAAIQTALKEAQENNVHGQAVTPFLLGRMSTLTGGSSLRANLGLLNNNARVAAEIAQCLPAKSLSD